MKTLQYQLSNGAWIDCENRTEEFIELCVKNGGLADRNAVIAALEIGKSVRNRPDNWYSNCRYKPAPRAPQAAPTGRYIQCRCGNGGYAGSYPFSTNPASGKCDDCL